MPRLRPVTDPDHDAVLALNAHNVTALAPMDRDRLVQLAGWADRFKEVGGHGDETHLVSLMEKYLT